MPTLHRILFLSHLLPYPPDSGAKSRTYNVLKQLRREFDIILLAFSRRNHQADAVAREMSRRHLADIVTEVGVPVPIASEHSLRRLLLDHLRSAVGRRPFSGYQFQSKHFESQLRRVLAEEMPALVHLDSIDLHRYVATLPKEVPIACTHHDIEPHLLELRAERVRPRLLGSYVRYQARLIEEVGRTLCPRFSANIVMSTLDAERLSDRAPGSKTVVVPNGVDTDYFSYKAGTGVPGRVAFVGPTYLFANRDAADHLVNEIWPIVRAKRPSATLQLIGRAPDPAPTDYTRAPGVTVLGHVSDIRPPLQESSCSVVPIRVGGGTRIKILESWAMGKPVVSTSVGCEGLEASDGENIFIRDTPREFADAVLRVLGDAQLQRRLGANGRKTAEQTYSWDTIGGFLCSEYRKLTDAAAASR